MVWTSRFSSPKGSVQQAFVRLAAVREQMLCLRSALSPQTFAYRAVVEVGGGHFLTASEEAQEAQLDGFRRLLCGLSYPLQILVVSRPLDLVPLLALPEERALPAPWHDFVRAQIAFVRQLAQQQTLLSRQIYLVIPAEEAEPSSPLRAFGLWGRVGHKPQRDAAFGAARHALAVRVAEVCRQCEHLGLFAHRLSDRELIHLYAGCLRPGEPDHSRLPEATLAAIDLPVRPAASEREGRAFASSGSRPDARRSVAGLFPHPIAAHRSVTRKDAPESSPGASAPGGDLARLPDLVAPASVAMQPDFLCIDGVFLRTLAVTALPRFVFPGFLRPLVVWREPLVLSLFYRPRRSASMLRELLRHRTDYRSSLESARRRGALADPHLEVADADVADLVERLVSGEERLLDVSLYLLLAAPSRAALDRRTERLSETLAQMLCVAHAASFEQDLGFKSCLPEGRDVLVRSLLLDSQSAAIATFPFLATSLLMPGGILEGATAEGEPVVVDRWASDLRTAHRLIVAPSGAGKSYKCKLDLLRLCMRFAQPIPAREEGQPDARAGEVLPFQALVIDPEGEYRALCTELSGQWIRLAPGSPEQLNPLDVAAIPDAAGTPGEAVQADALAETIHEVHSFLDLALADHRPDGLGTLTAQEHALLDHALYQTYATCGIQRGEPRTYARRPPLLADLLSTLEAGRCGPDPTDLAARLDRFVHGSLSGLFRGPTNVTFDRMLVVFDVSALSGELRALGYFLLTRHLWQMCRLTRRERLLVIDELLSLYAYPEGARFLERLFQRARKQGLGLVGVTQHIGLLRESTIPANCATKLVMGQEPEALPQLADLFGLSAPEVARLSQCRKGEGLLLVGPHRLFLQIEATPLEHRLLTAERETKAQPGERESDPPEQRGATKRSAKRASRREEVEP
jgi:conjugal transfer ATP-binding protein TraC